MEVWHWVEQVQPLADLVADNFESQVGNMSGCYEMGTSEIEIKAVRSSVDVPYFAGRLRHWAEQVGKWGI